MSVLRTRRRRIAGVAVGLCAIAAPLVSIATPASAAPVNVTGGTVSWGIRSSFQNYIQGPGAAGAITTGGGVTYAGALDNPQPFVFPVSSGSHESPNTVANTGGSVFFSGHEGILEVNFSDVRVSITGTTGAIVVDATSRPNGATPQPAVTYDDVTFATLDLSAVTPTATSTSYVATNVPAKLTAAGVPILANFYAANSDLDLVSLDLTLEEPPPPPPTDTLTWKVSDQAWSNSGGLTQLKAGVAPAVVDAANGFVFPATGTSTYDPATGEAHAAFSGALQLGNTSQGGYKIQIANPEITIDADGAGTLEGDPQYCASTAACAAGWTSGNDLTIVRFDVQDDGGVVTDTGNRYTLTITPPWATANPANSFDSELIDFLPASLQGHFKNTGAAADSFKPAAPLTVTFAYTPPPPVGVSDSVDITTTVEPGTLAISIAGDTAVLPTPALNPAGTWLTTSGALPAVTVADTRATDPGWNVSAQLTDFGGPTPFAGSNLGWVPSVGTTTPGQAVTAGGTVAPGTGVSGKTLASATSGHGLGTAILNAALNLRVPTNTTEGTYTATLTLTAI